MKKTVLFVCGTRPEAIKMAPVVHAFARHPERFVTKLCATGQHKQMLDQTLQFFGLKPDVDLAIMKPGQTLYDVTTAVLTGIGDVLKSMKPDLVFVQGDTTTAMAGALAAFYEKIPVAHIEAGLRTGDKLAPWPEEMNRLLVSRLSDFHFAPTAAAGKHLAAENVLKNVHVVGNTVIDALLACLQIVKRDHEAAYTREFSFLDSTKRLILVTGHRRESFGEPFAEICRALADIVAKFPDVQLVYPVHLNPNVRQPVDAILRGVDRVHLLEPLEYPKLVWLMARSHLIVTDSGGIQEEAPSLGKPVLVMREVTERPEGIDAGCARLVGNRRDSIVAGVETLLTDAATYQRMSKTANPYGNGTSAQAIYEIIARDL
jgi:UDP-N-acetylglucosamine 2-epimerase (non-hydrolysing)